MSRKTIEFLTDCLKNHKFRISIHALEQIAEREITTIDISNIGHTLKSAKLQSNGTYKICGVDECGIDLTIICSIKGEKVVWIVSAF